MARNALTLLLEAGDPDGDPEPALANLLAAGDPDPSESVTDQGGSMDELVRLGSGLDKQDGKQNCLKSLLDHSSRYESIVGSRGFTALSPKSSFFNKKRCFYSNF